MYVIEELPDNTGSQRNPEYDKIFDGAIWVLVAGEDFQGDRKIKARNLRSAAQQRKIRVSVCNYGDTDIAVQYRGTK